MLINAGADLNIVDNSGNSALMTAAKKEKYEIAEILIKSGANLNIQNNAGQTALSLAEDMKMDDLLSKYGAV
jgi:ankyrin repeat protein